MLQVDVTIRPVSEEDLPQLAAWRSDVEHESHFNSFLALHRRLSPYAAKWAADGMLSEEDGSLVICLDGKPVGAVQYFPSRYGPNRGSLALCLGIAIEPSARGQGVGSRAQRLVADYLFSETLVHRVEATTDVENLAEQGALKKAGFSQDGVLRGAQWRNGEWHDMVIFSRLRTDQ